MKRHPQLQDLSREHHTALQLALRAKRAALSGDPAQVAASAAACVAAFAAELDPHFLVEERSLLPMLSQSGETALVRRTEHEHGELRDLIGQLRQPAAASLLRFAELLTAHVRFEERELFETLETCLERAGKD
ncbi:MAG: hemerythrin domain-containing protein [Rhodocyclaceae bacterium]